MLTSSVNTRSHARTHAHTHTHTDNASNVGKRQDCIPAGTFASTHKPNMASKTNTSTQRPDQGVCVWVCGWVWVYRGAFPSITGTKSHDRWGPFLGEPPPCVRAKKEDINTQSRRCPGQPHSPPHSVCCPHTVSVAGPIERGE